VETSQHQDAFQRSPEGSIVFYRDVALAFAYKAKTADPDRQRRAALTGQTIGGGSWLWT
jgi:hypothetical protein